MFLVSLDDLGTSKLILISLISKFVEVPLMRNVLSG